MHELEQPGLKIGIFPYIARAQLQLKLSKACCLETKLFFPSGLILHSLVQGNSPGVYKCHDQEV